MAQAFVSNRVVTPTGTRPGALLVEGGRLLAVCSRAEIPAGAVVEELGNLAILPGLVDTHVHINEPGRTEWEGFRTATRAAAAGGYTALVDMPLNCLPETTTVEALEAKRAAAAGQCLVDWMSWGGAVADNQAHILPLARAGVPGFKCFLIYPGCDGFTMIDQQQLEAALPAIAESGLPLLVHAELAGPIDAAMTGLGDADWRRYATYLASRPDAAELEAIRLMLRLCREYGFRLHIVHLATAEALEELRAARAEGLPVSVETCPHYLHAAAEEIADGATLWKPCPPAMKRVEEGRFDLAWGGVASLSVALPVVWTDAARRGFSLDAIARWMSAAPAELAGISKRAGRLEAGREANFVVFDPDAEFTVAAEALHSRHAVSPYLGEWLRGAVRATYLRGEAVFSANGFMALPQGRELSVF
jgi:allantoinase